MIRPLHALAAFAARPVCWLQPDSGKVRADDSQVLPLPASRAPVNRWLIAIMGTLLQLCLGSVYAWSYFQQPLVERMGWQHTQVAWTFSFAIGFLGLAAAVGGVLLPKVGPRLLAVTGIVLFGAGYLLAALALQLHSLPLLWLGYGVIGGIGLGLGYVTPVATVAKWFPDKKGLVTGMVVMGFGFGALLMSKVVAPGLMTLFGGSLPKVFVGIGVALGALGLVAALFMRNPPAVTTVVGEREPVLPHVFSRRFALMWLLFFCNIVAGIAIISFQSPLLQDLLRTTDPLASPAALAGAGATLIAVSSVFNGLGRFAWGALSDRLGQLYTFRVMLATQALAFVALIFTGNVWLFGALVCYVLLCYGGGFGVMPSFIHHAFGARLMPVLYGGVLTAWSAGGIVGPQMVAWLKDTQGAHASGYAFAFGATLLTVGLILALLCRPAERPAE